MFNPAFNLEAFAVRSESSAPPAVNAIYLRDGKYDSMTRADVAATFAAFRAQTTTDHLALFFHGGLVDKASGQQGAANEYEAYKDIVFPLFFIWHSGIWELLAHHLPLIFAETIFGRIVDHITSLLSSKLSQATATMSQQFLLETYNQTPQSLESLVLTSSDIDGFMEAIKADERIQHEVAAIARSSESVETLLAAEAQGNFLQLSPRTYLSPTVVGAIRGAYVEGNRSSVGTGQKLESVPFDLGGAIQGAWAVAKASVPSIINCVKRFVAKRDHGFTCTIVEEVLRALYLANAGSSIWEEMKRETADAFGADGGVYGGTGVIQEICAEVKQNPSTRITLVGHSTGAVYIGNFLRHIDIALTAQGDSTTSFEIIFMAPASTMEFFVNTYTNRISGIRIFQMQDATEQQDHLMSRDAGPSDSSILGHIYPRSLLYLVSGICEYFEGQGGAGVHSFDGDDMPLLGMDRFFSQSKVFTAADYPSVDQIRRQFAVAPPPSPTKFVRVLSPTPPTPNDGYRCTAIKHGNFRGDGPTIASVRFCFEHGL